MRSSVAELWATKGNVRCIEKNLKNDGAEVIWIMPMLRRVLGKSCCDEMDWWTFRTCRVLSIYSQVEQAEPAAPNCVLSGGGARHNSSNNLDNVKLTAMCHKQRLRNHAASLRFIPLGGKLERSCWRPPPSFALHLWRRWIAGTAGLEHHSRWHPIEPRI